MPLCGFSTATGERSFAKLLNISAREGITDRVKITNSEGTSDKLSYHLNENLQSHRAGVNLPGKKTLLLSLFIALFLTCCCSISYAEVKLIPQEGLYHSAHPDFGIRDDIVSKERVTAFTDLANKNLTWAYLSFHWDRGLRFPLESCKTLHSMGVVPLVGMMPWSELIQNRAEKKYTLSRIIAGDFDTELARCALDVKSLGFPIIMEFGPEADGAWFPWSGAWNGRDRNEYGVKGWPDGPERFRNAYRHIIDIFRRNGAVDITWVFHVASAEPKSGLEWNAVRYYYPGDDYIDWIGVSVYGRLKGSEPPTAFDKIMQRVYPTLTSLSPSKPIAILELGVSDTGERADKADWIRAAFESITSGRYPRVKAVSWWNKIYRPNGSRSTLEIDSSAESLAAYREGVRSLLDTPKWSGF